MYVGRTEVIIFEAVFPVASGVGVPRSNWF